MADIREALREAAIQIRDEHKLGANTAKRVGSLLLALVDAGINIKELEKTFLHKDKPDTAQEIITFLKGVLIGKNGSGISVLENGMSQAVVDYLYVKTKAVFDELEVKKKTYVGGEQILSPAGMKCIRVEELDDAYRCYFKFEEDGIEIDNPFTPGTLAISQECNVRTGVSHHVGNRYYWRLVTAVGTDYIDLSRTECDPNVENDVPAAGDDIVGLGHKTDITRQAAIILSSVGEASPSMLMYQGIDDFTLSDKEVIGFDYNKASGKARMRVYGDTYIGARDNSQYIELKDDKVNVKGTVHILPGSTGFENVSGMEFGKVNLLRNSGFTGDYNSAKLEDGTELEAETDLYSQALKFWAATGAVVNSDAASHSGRSVTLTGGTLVQTLYYKMMEGEKYILSFRAKGASVSVSCAGLEKTEQLTSAYRRFIYKFDATAGTELTVSGTCTVCELQLERGTVPSEWSISPLDNNSSEAKFEALRYLTDVIKNGSSTFIGGLGLLSMLKLGNYVDGEMKRETAGVSGVYNDDDDVAFYAGGNYEQAVRTVLEYLDNPNRELDEATLAEIAKVVITHGGRAILNDVIVRGYIYALGGVFKGKVTQGNGLNVMNEDGSVSFAGGKIKWGPDGYPVFEGKVTTSLSGRRIEIDAQENEIVMYDTWGRAVTRIYFFEIDEGNGGAGITMTDYNAEGKIEASTSIVPGYIYINDSDMTDGFGASEEWASLEFNPYGINFIKNGRVVKRISAE